MNDEIFIGKNQLILHCTEKMKNLIYLTTKTTSEIVFFMYFTHQISCKIIITNFILHNKKANSLRARIGFTINFVIKKYYIGAESLTSEKSENQQQQ